MAVRLWQAPGETTEMAVLTYETLSLTWLDADQHCLHVALNRPKKMNAVNLTMWRDLRECFVALAVHETLRCVVLSGGESKSFCGGIDISDLGAFMDPGSDAARTALRYQRSIRGLQASFDAIEALPVPVIAAVHGACYGAGVDLVTACDVRWASADATFCVKEVDIGLAADVGTLARLPKVVGSASLVAELALTARTLGAAEALSSGLVSRVVPGREQLLTSAAALAALIAGKSPVAIVGTKHNLLFARDHTVAEANRQVALWNASCLQTADIAAAAMQGRAATFSKL